MKELLQQAVGNELIHCRKLLGKTKHIQKKKRKIKIKDESKNPGKRLILRKKGHFSSKNYARVT